jgi:hypothetical protein
MGCALLLTRNRAQEVVNGLQPILERMTEITLANDPHQNQIVVTFVVTFEGIFA